MLIEAIEHPIRYQWPDGEIRLQPGNPIEIQDETRALKVLAKAPGKVRIVKNILPADLRPRVLISWHSPLFGRVQGVVAMEPERGWLVVRGHSITGNLALVSIDWDLLLVSGRQEEGGKPNHGR